MLRMEALESVREGLGELSLWASHHHRAGERCHSPRADDSKPRAWRDDSGAQTLRVCSFLGKGRR